MCKTKQKLWPIFAVAVCGFISLPGKAPAQDILPRKLSQKPNLARLHSIENQKAAITILQLENVFITQGKADSLLVAWKNQSRTCRIRYASAPGNGNPDNYPETFPNTGTGQLSTPRFANLDIGIYYCILQDINAPREVSIEFLVFVQPPVPVRTIEPVGKVSLEQAAPTFRWEPINGVPYYLILVSQGDLQIETNPETGEIDKFIGVNIIWEAFTDQSTIQYGARDPAGIWPLENTPPLLPGETYHWLVFSAFAPGLQWVAWDLLPLSTTQFELSRATLPEKPTLIFPGPEQWVTTDEIQFKWHSVPGARRYRVLLWEKFISKARGEGTLLIWQHTTLDTTAKFIALDFLSQEEYNVQIVAEAPNAISASQKQVFHYNPFSGVLMITSHSRDGNALLPYADITLEGTRGTGSPFPFFTDEFGFLGLDLPEGDYVIHARARGFLPVQAQTRVNVLDTTRLNLIFDPAPFLVLGRVVSSRGSPIPFATIVPAGEAQRARQVDGMGHFVLGSPQPLTSLQVYAPGYRSRLITRIVYTGEAANVGDIELQPATAVITGTLQDATGLPLSGIHFKLQKGIQQLDMTTGTTGRYQFLLEEGQWSVEPFYAGYYSEPEKYLLNLQANQTREANFLFFESALLEGRVFASGQLVGGAQIVLQEKTTQQVWQTHSDHFGMFHLDVKPGQYALEVSQPGFGTYRSVVSLAPGRVTQLDVHLKVQKVVWGHVQNAQTGEPLPGVEIIDASQGTVLATTSTAGTYAFSPPNGQDLRVDARLPGFVSPGPKTIDLANQDSLRVDFALQPASAIIRGKVVSQQKPVAGARVWLLEKNIFTVSNSSGEFEFNLQPGLYHLQALLGCSKSDTVQAEAGLGESIFIQISLNSSGASVSGHVYDATHKPLAQATILASGLNTFTARSDSSGFYQLCLDPGPYFILVSRVGYLSADTTIIIAENDSLNNINFFLEDNFAEIVGQTLTVDGQPIPGVKLILSNFWQQMETVSDAQGSFQFSGIFPGESTVLARADSFFAAPVRVVLAGKEKRNLIIKMNRSDGFIAGRVVDGYTGAGIDSALVVAQLQGSNGFFSAYSQAPDGRYRITKLPNIPGQTYRILASKSGYTLKALRDSVQANSQGVDLELLGNYATLSGRVKAEDTGLPIADAQVMLTRPGEPTRIASTDVRGEFTIPGLVFTFTYRVVIQHALFWSDTLQVSVPAAGIEVALRRKMAFARGRVVRQPNGSGYAGARVIFSNIDGKGRSDTTLSDSQGKFFHALWPGTYQIQVRVPQFFTSPPQKLVTLAPGDTTPMLEFTLEKQTLMQMTIRGPEQILNQGLPIQYRVEATDSSGRTINELPGLFWRVNIAADTAQISSTGLLSLARGYTGPLVISVRDSTTGVSDTLLARVTVQIDSASDFVVFSRSGAEIELIPGSVSQPAELAMETTVLSPVQKVEEAFRVLPPLYRIIPENLQFQKPIKLLLPYTGEAQPRGLTILRWDNLISAWESQPPASNWLPGSVRLSRFIDQGGRYAIVAFSQPLAIQYLELQPNPFSPRQSNAFGEPGIAIRFSITSDQAALPLVTAKIYNLQGTLIAILANQKPVPKGPQHLGWQGLTLDGRRARNGRYILRFSVEDGKSSQEVLKSIVLIE